MHGLLIAEESHPLTPPLLFRACARHAVDLRHENHDPGWPARRNCVTTNCQGVENTHASTQRHHRSMMRNNLDKTMRIPPECGVCQRVIVGVHRCDCKQRLCLVHVGHAPGSRDAKCMLLDRTSQHYRDKWTDRRSPSHRGNNHMVSRRILISGHNGSAH